MDQKQARLILIFGIVIVSSLMFNLWENEKQTFNNQNKTDVLKETSVESSLQAHYDNTDDEITVPLEIKRASEIEQEDNYNIPEERILEVETKLIKAKIDKYGGNIFELELKNHKDKSPKDERNYQIITKNNEKINLAESGILDEAKKGKFLFSSLQKKYFNESGDLQIELQHKTSNNTIITKSFIFKEDKYDIDVEYKIENKGNKEFNGRAYTSLKSYKEKKVSSGMFNFNSVVNTDGVNIGISTTKKKYRKFEPEEIKKKQFSENIKNGWSAIVEHYFITAWIPENTDEYFYQTRMFNKKEIGVTSFSDVLNIKPGERKIVNLKLFVGPEDQNALGEINENLKLTVDYGSLWIFCLPIFWLLNFMHSFVNNWGVAIILTTLIVRIALFKLASTSYRSMANMKKLQPRLDSLKEKYKDDKQALGQATLELYKKEKVNPFGGCFLILLQIPVFFSIYYVLFNSVELRHAPFVLWINDLSSYDPYFILPIMMGLTLMLQQMVSPPPQDPVQAKVMKFLPLFFTFLLVKSPSGLVLYWTFSNILSVAQQWYITKKVLEN